MKLTDITLINLKKLKEHKSKALFLIVPIAVLGVGTVAISSQINNFQIASEKSVFGTIEAQATLIKLQQNQEFSAGPNQKAFFNSDNEYTENDLEKIRNIENVEAASLNNDVPISNIKTSDLFNNINYQLNSLSTLDSTSAKLYSEQEFEYKEGDPIPIILNANTFMENYEDWGGKNKITIDPRAGRTTTGKPTDLKLDTPIKSRAIEYNKNDLLGKTFTLEFGNLDEISTFEVEPSAEKIVFKKLSKSEINEKISDREESISKYWNYKKLTTPIKYTFKVVGIIEDESERRTYVPYEFSKDLMSKYIKRQLDSRNSAALSNDLLNSTYLGLTYDGTELSSTNGGRFSGGKGFAIRIGGMSADSADSKSYFIPGLVIQLEDDGTSEIVGEYKKSNVYSSAVKKSDSITIKVNNVYNRAQVVEDLNEAGFSYQDLADLKVFDTLKNTLRNISAGLTISFIIISSGVIILTMTRFVSESKKEIGIFRAIGARKRDILTMFILQALTYTFLGFVIGISIGVVVNMAIAPFVSNSFDTLVTQTIKETYNVVNTIDLRTFFNLDFKSIGVYSILLLAIALVISYVPSLKASSISPVEAIRGE